MRVHKTEQKKIARSHRRNQVPVMLAAGSMLFLMSPSNAKTVTQSDSQDVAITVYNQNFGLVKEIRNVQMTPGINFVRFEDVAAAIDPTSVSFTSLTAPNSVVVREQNYQYDVMDPTTILSKSVGKNVTFRQYLSGGGVKELSGTLLNPPRVSIVDTNGNVSTRSVGMVVKTANGIVLNPSGETELQELPEGLVSQPSLLWKLETDKGGTHKTELRYQTKGMNWHCDYVAIANEDDSACDLTSWVTIDNKSGASYKRASLKLLAGDVHRVQPQNYGAARGMVAGYAMAKQQFQEKSFAEYHLYTLQGKTNVLNNETKQLSLFNVSSVPTKKLYIFDTQQQIYGIHRGGSNSQKVNVKLEIANSEANNLGMALPKGKVRVYKKDDDGSLQFVGEDAIDHTPRDEKIRLYIGDAFDLVGERKQMNFTQPNTRTQRITYQVSLRIHKDKKVTITAVEHAYGQWKILSSSHKYTKRDSHTFEFPVEVPARGEVKIDYEIEIRH